jgi:hypothetical protein
VNLYGLDKVTQAINRQLQTKAHKWNGQNKTVEEVMRTLLIKTSQKVPNANLVTSYMAYELALDKIAPGFSKDGRKGGYMETELVNEKIASLSAADRRTVQGWLIAADIAIVELAQYCTAIREFNAAMQAIPQEMEVSSQRLNFVIQRIHDEVFCPTMVQKAVAAFNHNQQQRGESPLDYFHRLQSTYFYLKNSGTEVTEDELRSKFFGGLLIASARPPPPSNENFTNWVKQISTDWENHNAARRKVNRRGNYNRFGKRSERYTHASKPKEQHYPVNI